MVFFDFKIYENDLLHISSSFKLTLLLKTLPFKSFAPEQLGASFWFVSPMPLPPDVANGIIFLPAKSKSVDDGRSYIPPDREADKNGIVITHVISFLRNGRTGSFIFHFNAAS